MLETLVLSVLFLVPLLTLALVIFLYLLEKEKTRQIVERIDKINFKPIEDEILKIVEKENSYLTKTFEMEMLLENYRKAALIIGEKVENLEKKFKEIEKLPKDYETTYRDVVRKLLDLDNKFTDKYRLLAEAVLKLTKEKK